jgi:predicted nucleic acid-binding protein
MEDTHKTRQYLKELNAVFVEDKIIVSPAIINSKIAVFTRKYYKKRNNKICYVDTNIVLFNVEWDKTKTHKNVSNIYINDWNNTFFKNEITKISKEYKEELIEKYIKIHVS